jgi:hypothetical protein
MRRSCLVPVLAGLLLVTPEARAQEPILSIEPRVGYATPIGEWADDDAVQPGFGFGAAILYTVIPNSLRVYLGYERYTFGLREGHDPVLGRLEGSSVNDGVRGGVRALLLPMSPVAPFVEGGVLYQRLDTSVWASGVRFGAASDRTVGFDLGAGVVVDIPTPQRYPVRLVPSVRYRQHALEYSQLADFVEPGTAASFVVELGLSVDY